MMQKPRNKTRMNTVLAPNAVPKIAIRFRKSGRPSGGISNRFPDCESAFSRPADRTARAAAALLPSQLVLPSWVADGCRAVSGRGAGARRGEAASREERRYRQKESG